jgi:hypothetical protein
MAAQWGQSQVSTRMGTSQLCVNAPLAERLPLGAASMRRRENRSSDLCRYLALTPALARESETRRLDVLQLGRLRGIRVDVIMLGM